MILSLLAGIVVIAQNKVTQFSVDPCLTDHAITKLASNHTIFVDPDVKPTRGLLVYLPGTNGVTTNASGFCSTAAEDGYQVINLMYPDSIPATVVHNSPDNKAFEKFRLEIIEGRDLSPQVEVDRANSIENRLIKLLAYLDKLQPGKGWGSYLAHGNLVWSKITFSGGSQGAGHAALIATKHTVRRVIALAGPKDYRVAVNKPAAWYQPCATPANRFYAFNHEQDKQGCDYVEQLQILKALGLDKFGGPVDVDTTQPPFKNSRILVTNYPGTQLPSVRAHASVIGDGVTPRTANGDFLFKPVWHYMLTNGD